MNEKKIFYVGTREFTSRKDGKTYYQVDYVRLDNGYRPKSDFISLEEFNAINQKMKDKHLCEVIGIFDTDMFDHIYLSAIK